MADELHARNSQGTTEQLLSISGKVATASRLYPGNQEKRHAGDFLKLKNVRHLAVDVIFDVRTVQRALCGVCLSEALEGKIRAVKQAGPAGRAPELRDRAPFFLVQDVGPGKDQERAGRCKG